MQNFQFSIDQIFDRSFEKEVDYYILSYQISKKANSNSYYLSQFLPIQLSDKSKRDDVALQIICSILNQQAGVIYIGANQCLCDVQQNKEALEYLTDYFNLLIYKIDPIPQVSIYINQVQQQELDQFQNKKGINLYLEYQINIQMQGEKQNILYKVKEVTYISHLVRQDQLLDNEQQEVKQLSLIQNLFLNKESIININEKLLRLKAYQYFQTEYVCILNLFSQKRNQFLNLLSWYLHLNQINYEFQESFQYFTFIKSSNTKRLACLIYKFLDLSRLDASHFIFQNKDLNYGTMRLQLCIQYSTINDKMQIENILKQFNYASHYETGYMIAFFYDIYEFMISQKILKKYKIKFDFYYYKPKQLKGDPTKNTLRNNWSQCLYQNGINLSNITVENQMASLAFKIQGIQHNKQKPKNQHQILQLEQQSYLNLQIDRHIKIILNKTNQGIY
ncbi:hypothetical protein ABPG74_022081 [Tetrahymena malaccensis]